ncbi:MAG: TnpV protein [Clostridia bacterium]
MELTYRQEGDYLVPNLELDEQPTQAIGKYGNMRRDYLMNHRQILFNKLVLNCKLQEHLVEIDQTANQRLELMMHELQKTQPAPNKMTQQMEWVAYMNSLHAQAEEVILSELIYN